ncbi:MAG: DUF3262 family protein [Candidatus Thiodiazotropha sp.]|jgi:integrating conjugative element protein (TIGR03758 family)
MTADQYAAFKEGAGNFLTAEELLWTIQAIGATAVFLYVAWLCYRAYDDYGEEVITANDMVIVWFRGVFVMMVLLYLLIN